jgi:hypothetical protein
MTSTSWNANIGVDEQTFRGQARRTLAPYVERDPAPVHELVTTAHQRYRVEITVTQIVDHRSR